MATYTFDATDKRSVNSFVGRVYGYMFFALLLTAVIAFGVGILFNLWIFGTLNPAAVDYGSVATNINRSGANALLAIMIISGIGLLIMTFVVHGVFFRNKHSLTIPFIIYVSLMGLLLSSLVIFVPWPVLGITFLITAGIFGIMFLIATLSKGSLNFLGILGFGLMMGALFLSLIGWIFFLTGALGAYLHLYWIISLLSFAAIMFITIWDMWRIKQIAQSGEQSNNVVLYCAFEIYVDFIYIFLRVLRIVSYFYSNK